MSVASGFSSATGASALTVATALTVGGKKPAEGPPIRKVDLGNGSSVSVRLYVKIPAVPSDQPMEKIANAAEPLILTLAAYAQKNAETLVSTECKNFAARQAGNKTHITSIRKSSKIFNPAMSVELVLRFSATISEGQSVPVVRMVKKLAGHIIGGEGSTEGKNRRLNYASSAANRTLRGETRSRRSRFTQFGSQASSSVNVVRGSNISTSGSSQDRMLADLRSNIMVSVENVDEAKRAFKAFAREQEIKLPKLVAQKGEDDKEIFKKALAAVDQDTVFPYRTLFKNMAMLDASVRDDVALDVAGALCFEDDDPDSTEVALDALGAFIAELAQEHEQLVAQTVDPE